MPKNKSDKKYYKDQLLNIDTTSEFPCTIKVKDSKTGETKWMSLNPDSAKVIRKWLKKMYLTESND